LSNGNSPYIHDFMMTDKQFQNRATVYDSADEEVRLCIVVSALNRVSSYGSVTGW